MPLNATFKQKDTVALRRLPVHQVFMFIGAEPNTSWLQGCVALDDKGYVVTGSVAYSGASAVACKPGSRSTA